MQRYSTSMAQILSEMNDKLIEGKMSQFHLMMKQKKTPEQIAKALKLDLKTVKALMKEQENDPVAKAQDNLQKQKKIADLKKQIDTINKSEALDKEDEPAVKKLVKNLRKGSKTHAKQADELEKDLKDDVNEVTVTIKSYDTKTGLDRQSEKQMNAVATRAGAKVKKSGNNVYKLTGNGKQISKFMANIDQIDGSFMTEENEFIIEFTDKQIERLRKEYEDLKGKETGINPEKFRKLRGMMKRFPKQNLLKLVKADIPVLTTGAKAALVMYHGMKWKQLPEDFLPYVELFAEEVDEQKGKFKSVDPKVYARISKMMRGSKEEKQGLANMLNYFMPPEVVDMVRDKFGIKMPRGKIKFTDL